MPGPTTQPQMYGSLFRLPTRTLRWQAETPAHIHRRAKDLRYNRAMTRRDLLAAAGAVCALPLEARNHFDKSRISAITDEIGRSTDESIAFAHQYGLTSVEIRNPPGDKREYFTLTEAEIKADAIRFRNEGLKVSFVNTSLL